MSDARQATIRLTVNGDAVEATVPVRRHLLDFLRLDLELTGSHLGCEHGVCGACTVRVDGVAVRGCLMLAVQADGTNVETVEGFADTPLLAELQEAFAARNALQCGFCTPGMLATAAEIVATGAADGQASGKVVDRDAIREALSGNYCRCTGYQAIVDAVATVAKRHWGAA